MKKIIALTFLAASALAMPAAPAFANSSVDRLCGPDAPEGYKRPGGYCEQIDSTSSLVESEKRDCYYVVPYAQLAAGKTVLVASSGCVYLQIN